MSSSNEIKIIFYFAIVLNRNLTVVITKQSHSENAKEETKCFAFEKFHNIYQFKQQMHLIQSNTSRK